MADQRVALVGAGGFVGSAVAQALAARGAQIVRLHAPRLRAVSRRPSEDMTELEPLIERTTSALKGVSAVVNAAGVADAAASDSAALFGANALLPGVLATACSRTGARFIHVSSAAVQGRLAVLDSSDVRAPTTEYARSKALGEELVHQRYPEASIYRPPGVHGAHRAVTRSVVKLARSPFSTVAQPGTAMTPQALQRDVGDAVAFLALCDTPPPPIVHHPPSGLTTAELLELLGEGRRPRRVPGFAAHAMIAVISSAGRLDSRIGAMARRLEVLWLGQEQAPSWLTAQGWSPVTTRDDWLALGRTARHDTQADGTNIATTEDTT